jgi:hypothetical protein
MPVRPLRLTLLAHRLGVCRLEPTAAIPAWATASAFFSVTRTAEELSIVCAEEEVPAGVRCERGWRALKLEGPLGFGEVGVLEAVAAPLAEAGVGILAIATYDTDYVLVKEAQLGEAIGALSQQGFWVELWRG